MENRSKNILYIVTRLPWPLIGGDRVHIYHYLKELKERGNKITIITLVAEDDDLQGALQHNEFYTKLIPIKFNKKLAYLNAAKAVFNDKPFIVEYFNNKEMRKVVDNELATGNYDVVIGYMIRSIPYLKKHKNIKKIIHICDTYAMLYKRRIKEQKNWFDKLKIGIEYLKIKHYESMACDISDKQVLISEADKDYLKNFAKRTDKLTVINWTTDTDYFAPQNAELKNNICMVGSMQYIPNSEAAMYFATKVFPLIKREIPDVKFKIIGAKPRKELFQATKNIADVEITGRVEDVREYMKDCKVSVCPTRIVSGMQTKLLEALAMGIPVVTTPESAAAFGENQDVLITATTTKEYAEKVINIMKNPELQSSISKKSRDYITEKFSWNKIGDEWNSMIQEVCNE